MHPGKFCAGLVLAATLMSATAAQAVVVDLWQSSGNGTAYNDNYGVVGSVIQARTASAAGSAAAINGSMAVDAISFADMYHVIYSGGGYGDLAVLPYGVGVSEGITLYGFDLGTLPGASENVDVRIWNGDYSAELTPSQTLAVGSTHASYVTSLFSLTGFHIQFSVAGAAIAIDNLAFDVGDFAVSQVPLPAGAWLLSSGMGLITLQSWRKRRRERRRAG